MANPVDSGKFDAWLNDTTPIRTIPPKTGTTGGFDTWIGSSQIFTGYAEANAVNYNQSVDGALSFAGALTSQYIPAPKLITKAGHFATGTGAVASTVVVELGFTPTAILFFWNGRTESTDASGRTTFQAGFGAAVSPTDRRYAGCLVQDNVATTVNNMMQGNAACIGIADTADAIDGLMDLQSMDATGFTLVVDDQFSASFDIQYLAIAGPDLTNVATGQLQKTASNPPFTQDYTGFSFQPDLVLTFGTFQAVNNNTRTADANFYIGASDGTNHYISALGSNDAVTTPQAAVTSYSGECVGYFSAAINAFSNRANISAMLSNGFTMNWIAGDLSAPTVNFIAFKGLKFALGDLLTSSSSSTVVEDTGSLVTIRGGLLISHGHSAQTAGTYTDDNQLSIGAFSSTTSQTAVSVFQDDKASAANSVSASSSEHDSVYINNDATSGAIAGKAHVSTLAGADMTLTMDTLDNANNFLWYLVLGEAGVTTPQSVSGSLSATGTLSAITSRVRALAGALSATGTLSAITSRFRSLSGSLTFSGTVTGEIVSTTTLTLSDSTSLTFSDGTPLTLQAGGEGSISGSLSSTLENIVGTLLAAIKVSGASSKTLDSITLVSAGTITSAGGRTGTLTQTLASITSASAGKIQVKATSTPTLAGITSTSAGKIQVKASTVATLGGVTSTSAGKIQVKGATTKTLAGITVSSAGSVSSAGARVGSLNQTLAGLTSASAGKVQVKAITAKTLDAVISTSAGKVQNKGAGALVLGPVISLSAGKIQVKGITTKTLAGLLVSSHGSIGNPPVTGTLAKVLTDITGTGAGKIRITGQTTVTLAGLTGNLVGKIRISGTSSATLNSIICQSYSRIWVSGHAVIIIDNLVLDATGIEGIAPLKYITLTLFVRDNVLTLEERTTALDLAKRSPNLTAKVR